MRSLFYGQCGEGFLTRLAENQNGNVRRGGVQPVKRLDPRTIRQKQFEQNNGNAALA